MLWVTVLDYTYWVTGAALGGIFGTWVSFSTKGLDFVMTAMFVVIFYGAMDERKTARSIHYGYCDFGYMSCNFR
ncbi:MAG: hypothetical protein KIG40_00325 [Bacteroidaceae bacterium]|nr:hypothetical protein [Bacteroidaceae bacterium]